MLSDGAITYLYGNARLGQDSGGEMEFFMTDALGSVRQVADDTAIILVKVYEPYGEVLREEGRGQSDYGFGGEWTSPYNEFVYLRARWYAVGQGRFLTRDTWRGSQSEPMSYNAWLYVSGNPINYGDPTGMLPGIQNNDDRDLTDWLYREMVTNATTDNIVMLMRSYNQSALRFLVLATFMGCPTSPSSQVLSNAAAGAHGTALTLFYLQVRNGARWDFKDEIGIRLGPGVTFCTPGTCYNDIEYSVPGNIFYGFIGRASGFPWWEIKAGAAWAEQHDAAHDPTSPEYVPLPEDYNADPFWDVLDPVASNFGDEVHDNDAVTFGIKLWDQNRSGLQKGTFQTSLVPWINKFARFTPRPGPVLPKYADDWPYPVGYFNNSGRDYDPINDRQIP